MLVLPMTMRVATMIMARATTTRSTMAMALSSVGGVMVAAMMMMIGWPAYIQHFVR